MSIFQANEFLLNLPDGLKDKTVNAFSLTDQGPSEIAIVVSRERPKSGETLERYVERSLNALLSRLPMFEVSKRELIRVDSQPAFLTEFTWQSSEGKMFQRQVTLYAKGPNLMLIITGTRRDRLTARFDTMFSEFIAGFRLRPS